MDTEKLLKHISSWPEVPNFNRNDSEIDIFASYYDTVNQHLIQHFIETQNDKVKSTDISETLRESGNDCFKNKKYYDALYYYTQSLIFAPRLQDVYGLSLANRSAVLFVLKKYKECLVDIDLAVSTKYPKHLLFKVLIRKTECLLKLKQYSEALKAFQKAKHKISKTKIEVFGSFADGIMQKMKNVEKVLKTVKHKENGPLAIKRYDLPVLDGGENNQFINASRKIFTKQNNKIGRYVAANEPIKKGSVLFVEEPYSVSHTYKTNTNFYICNQCLNRTIICFPCDKCTEIYFCSTNCKDACWNIRHKWECYGFTKTLFTRDMTLALGILFRASYSGLERKQVEEDKFGHKTHNYPYVNLLVTHKHNIPLKLFNDLIKISVWLVVYLKYYTDYFNWLRLQDPNRWKSNKLTHRTIGGYLLKHLLLIKFNAEKITDFVPGNGMQFAQGIFNQNVAIGLYVSSSLINHSCIPNAVVSYDGNMKIIRAIKEIQEGDEITVSYFEKSLILREFLLKLNNDKRKKWLKRYLFTCNCWYCAVLPLYSNTFPWTCPKCQNFAITAKNLEDAICTDCYYKFSLNGYKQFEMILEEKYNLLLNERYAITDLNKINIIMKNIYHPLNLHFINLYSHYVDYYEKEGDFRQCGDFIEKVANLRFSWFGDTDEIFATYLVYMVFIFVKYFISLKNVDVYSSQLEKNIKLTIEKVIRTSVETLQYHMSSKNIDIFLNTVTELLNSKKYMEPSEVNYVVYINC